MEYKTITMLHGVIENSVCTINGKLSYSRITDAIIKLANVIRETETDEFVWYIGEYSHATLMDIVVGAYWHYSQYHNGQDSKEYVALSTLGTIYSPGMECEPEEESSEYDFYKMLNDLGDAHLTSIAV